MLAQTPLSSKADATWRDHEHPQPVFDSSRLFDRSHHPLRAKCQLALKSVQQDAESEVSVLNFQVQLQELSRPLPLHANAHHGASTPPPRCNCRSSRAPAIS